MIIRRGSYQLISNHRSGNTSSHQLFKMTCALPAVLYERLFASLDLPTEADLSANIGMEPPTDVDSICSLSLQTARECTVKLIWKNQADLLQVYLTRFSQLRKDYEFFGLYRLNLAVACHADRCVQLLINLGDPLDKADCCGLHAGRYPLGVAVASEAFNLIPTLIEHGAKMAQGEQDGWTMLHMMCATANVDGLALWRQLIQSHPGWLLHGTNSSHGGFQCALEILLINSDQPEHWKYIEVLFEENFTWPIYLPTIERSALFLPICLVELEGPMPLKKFKRFMDYYKSCLPPHFYRDWLNIVDWFQVLLNCCRGANHNIPVLQYLLDVGIKVDHPYKHFSGDLLSQALSNGDFSLEGFKVLLRKKCLVPDTAEARATSIFFQALERDREFLIECYRFGARPFPAELCDPRVRSFLTFVS